MVKYTFGELDGPFRCEYGNKSCGKECWSIYLDKPVENPRDIINQSLGKALCADHAPENFTPGFGLASMIKDN